MTILIKKKSGAALITCLMLLLIMTLLGVSAMVSSTMEEKMAGNVRNKHISFNAAEAALRAGEEIAKTLTSDSVTTPASNPASSTDSFYTRSDPADANYPLWEDENAVWQSVENIGNTRSIRDPEYLIERFGTAFKDDACGKVTPLPDGCEITVYRVTARGWGLNDNAISIVQSTYK